MGKARREKKSKGRKEKGKRQVGRFSIFHAKLRVLEGLGALFGTFFGTLLSFFLFNQGRAREARER